MSFIGKHQIYTIDKDEPVRRVEDWATQATSINQGITGAVGPALARITTLEGDVAASKFVRGTLPPGRDLNDLSRTADSGLWQLNSSNTYPNNPFPGEGSTLVVSATDFSGEQRLTRYSHAGEYRRVLDDATIRPRGWSAWDRYDIERQRVLDIETALPDLWGYRGTVPTGTDLDSLRYRSSSGIHILGNTETYLNRPIGSGNRVSGELLVFTTGVGDTIQTVQYRFGAGRYTREETSAGSFSPWRRVDNFDWDSHIRETELAQGRTALAESATPITPMMETSGLWTTYGAGEALIDRVERRHYPRRNTAIPFEVKVLGYARTGRQIRAVIHGDPTKPALMIQSGTHGDETSSRESVLKMVTDLEQEATMQDYCVIVVPTVNVDGTNLSRLNDYGTDLNRHWLDEDDTEETRAVKTLFADYNIRAVLDCHEGGSWDICQFAINETVGDIATSQLMFDTAAAAVDADPDAFPSGTWVDEERVGSAMYTFPLQYGVPYLLVEMPGGLGDRTYSPTPARRMHTYRVVLDAIHGLFAADLATFTAAP